MSMDLAKKTYSTTPDYFIAGTTVGIVTAAKEASAAIAAHNLVLMGRWQGKAPCRRG